MPAGGSCRTPTGEPPGLSSARAVPAPSTLLPARGQPRLGASTLGRPLLGVNGGYNDAIDVAVTLPGRPCA
jgi:hypothetical protein